MTLEDVLQELVEQLGSNGDYTVGWQQVREWPAGAIGVFEKAGWITPAAPATSVECPGCEDNCFMPVHVLPAHKGRPARAYVACDRRDYVGRTKIAMSQLQQWQITEGQIACWLSGALGLTGKPEKDKASGVFTLGKLQGKNRVGTVAFDIAESACVKASGHWLSLRQIVSFHGDRPSIDREAILNLVDLPPISESKDGDKSFIARREVQRRGGSIEVAIRKIAQEACRRSRRPARRRAARTRP